ncbi:DUF3093 domain-containing protein [Leucobacter viscericola]|uniref:DUF3093 domain-containing protein n=1 Tax=Leucobacter viscericola TaxID=2714935 RepID=A0A6G7XBQ7_9MICO|nr:DUF3093 domain-containing protein [Leucobacter viscericola]QIK61993.1 DUF3093 domain-containing protein [Leucobacter viscericola]
MTVEAPPQDYRERLLPGPSLFVALLLLIPAVALVMTPINPQLALPTGIAMYVLIAGSFLVLSPSLLVRDGRLTAGRAEIPVDQLGEVELLGSDALRRAIGPGTDARSYLLVRGWIHRGVRVENIDPADPAPQWVLTSRHPEQLALAIEAAKRA